MGACPGDYNNSAGHTYSFIHLLTLFLNLDFTSRLNAALLSFDIDQNINQLKNVSMSLRALNQSTLADQVDNITDILCHIREIQIPDIQNQTVSMCRLLSKVYIHMSVVHLGLCIMCGLVCMRPHRINCLFELT